MTGFRKTTVGWLVALLLAAWLPLGCVQERGPGQTSEVAPSEELRPSERRLPATEEPLALSLDTMDVPAPNFALPQLGSKILRLSDYRGRVVLLNFWATWCPPCRAEIPDLNKLQSELGPAGLEVIGISLDEDGFESVRPFAEEFDVAYPLVVDDGTVAAQYGSIQGLPTTFVVDRNGQIVRRVTGLFPIEQMRPVLEELLAQAPLE